MVSRLCFDPSTLALKGHNPHNKPIPIFRDFFILSHFTTLHCTDIFHMDTVFDQQSSTNLAQTLSQKQAGILVKIRMEIPTPRTSSGKFTNTESVKQGLSVGQSKA